MPKLAQKTATPSPSVNKEKVSTFKKSEPPYGNKVSKDSKKADSNCAYLPDLDCDTSMNLAKKKVQLEKEINKIFSDKLPDIRLSIFKKRNSDDTFMGSVKNSENKHQESEREKSQSQLGISKKATQGKVKKNNLNDSSCYGSSNRFDYKSGYKNIKASKKHGKKKDTSLPPPIKNQKLEPYVLPSSSIKGRNYQNINQIISQFKNDHSKSSLLSEQEILNYVFSSRNDMSNIDKATKDNTLKMYPSNGQRSMVSKTDSLGM